MREKGTEIRRIWVDEGARCAKHSFVPPPAPKKHLQLASAFFRLDSLNFHDYRENHGGALGLLVKIV